MSSTTSSLVFRTPLVEKDSFWFQEGSDLIIFIVVIISFVLVLVSVLQRTSSLDFRPLLQLQMNFSTSMTASHEETLSYILVLHFVSLSCCFVVVFVLL